MKFYNFLLIINNKTERIKKKCLIFYLKGGVVLIPKTKRKKKIHGKLNIK